jgi:excisionase family DNA binding protein
MITVPEAARRTGKDPETIRRWIRSGKLRATKLGTQHMIEEGDLENVATDAHTLEMPARWRTFDSGRPVPDVVAALERSRRGR